MGKFLALIFSLIISSASWAQVKAITETGEEVLLYSDGSWKSVSNNDELFKSDIPVNKKEFDKPKGASFVVKSKKNNSAVWINPKEWRFKKAGDGEDAEYEFQHSEHELYGLILTEEVSIPIESFREIAIENARDAAPDAELTFSEYRTVNGHKMLMLKIKGTISGIKFGYLGYYFSTEEGSVQFIVYSSQTVLEKHEEIAMELLNGLGVQ